MTKIRDGQLKSETITTGSIDDTTERYLQRILISSGDSTPDFVNTKFLAGTNITLNTIGSFGSNQQLAISSSGGGTTDHALLSHLDFASSGHTGFVTSSETLSTVAPLS